MHDIARIDQPETGLARQRRFDRRIAKLRRGVVDRRLIAFDLCGQLVDVGLLSIELLTRRKTLLRQCAVTGEVEFGVVQIGLVLCFFGLRLLERSLIGPWIDLHQQIAFLHDVALTEVDLGDLTIDAASNRDGVVRLHGAKPVQINRKVGALYGLNGNRDRWRAFLFSFGAVGRINSRISAGHGKVIPAHAADYQHACDKNRNVAAAARP